ncbi:hypothetical protein ACROYT_G001225 [Oculina patagonica]
MSDEERIHLVSQKACESEESSKPAAGGADGAESSDAETAFEDVPVYITCPYCHEKIVTRTSFKSGKYTYWTSACLCIFQCYCCMWIPFILDGLKNVVHSCPKCGAKLSEYSRFRWDRIWNKKKKHRQAQHNYTRG